MKDVRPNVSSVTRQTDSESLQEYEQALRTLYKQGWPSATDETRDAALKRRFEDGVASPELSQYLRLDHRKSNLEETVEQARLYAATVDGAKTKKTVRFIAETDEDADGQTVILNHLRVLEKKLDQMERGRSRNRAPKNATEGQTSASRSPSPLTGTKENKDQPAKNNFPARRFDQTQGRVPWGQPSTRSFRGAGTTSPVRNPNQNQRQTAPRGRRQGCWTCGKLGCHSLLHRRTDVSPPRQVRFLLQSPVNSPQPRRNKSGCFVCGRQGCHSIFHDNDGLETDGNDRGFPPLPASTATTNRHVPQSGNDSRNRSMGARAPQNS